jgi:hypothetical protein
MFRKLSVIFQKSKNISVRKNQISKLCGDVNVIFILTPFHDDSELRNSRLQYMKRVRGHILGTFFVFLTRLVKVKTKVFDISGRADFSI